jgi:short subunit dehydrogenase-like uncharacterized protein
MSNQHHHQQQKKTRNGNADDAAAGTSCCSSSFDECCQLEPRHRPVVYSHVAFICTAALLPVVSLTVLPLSIAYQLVKVMLQILANTKKSTSSCAFEKNDPLDSGYKVDASSSMIVPRNERKFDVVILGVTGFTGRLAMRHMAMTYDVNKTVKWAIAGRSKAKLDQVKRELAKELGNHELLNVETILVDTKIPSTMPRLVEQTRVVATTAGPFALYGNAVVEFCCKFGTHYVDITGEVDWVKTMLIKWQDTAQASGAMLVPFCGQDSIPWDLSVMKLQQVLKKEHNDDLASVTFWDVMAKDSPGGTWESVLAKVEGRAAKPPQTSFDPFLRLPDGSISSHVCTPILPLTMMPSNSTWDIQQQKKKGHISPRRWTVPFIMAPVNGQVVRWSYAMRGQQLGSSKISSSNHKTELIYQESEACADFKTAFVNFAGMVMVGMCLLNPVTARLVRRLLGHAAGQGASMYAMENEHFLHITGKGIGVHGHVVESQMYFRRNAGCIDSAVMMIESALCLALDQDRLQVKLRGGFCTPSIAFGDVLLERILKTGSTTFAVWAVPKEASS